MKSSSNPLKLPINVVKPMPKQQPRPPTPKLNIQVKQEKQEDDDIVFLEEKPSSAKTRAKKDDTAKKKDDTVNKSCDTQAATSSSTAATSVTTTTIVPTETPPIPNSEIVIQASAENEEPSEFIFNYTPENEDIGFDSDDELVSIFDM